MSQTERQIAQLVGRACALDPDSLRRDRSLIAYGLDSMRAAELLGELESTFGVAIADEELVHVQTLAQMARLIDDRLDSGAVKP